MSSKTIKVLSVAAIAIVAGVVGWISVMPEADAALPALSLTVHTNDRVLNPEEIAEIEAAVLASGADDVEPRVFLIGNFREEGSVDSELSIRMLGDETVSKSLDDAMDAISAKRSFTAVHIRPAGN